MEEEYRNAKDSRIKQLKTCKAMMDNYSARLFCNRATTRLRLPANAASDAFL